MWPWLVIAGAAYYWYLKTQHKKPTPVVAPVSQAQPVEKRQPKMRVFDDPEPQEAPPAEPSRGGGSGYGQTDGPPVQPVTPTATPAPTPSASPLPYTKTLTDFAKTVTPQSVTFAPRPTAPVESAPAVGPSPLSGGSSSVQATTKPVTSSPIQMTDLRQAKKTF